MEEIGGGPVGPFEDLEVIRVRTWRRWQAKARCGSSTKGPWPRPARVAARDLAVKHALAHPAWGHRKVWAMTRHDGHVVSQATVLRLLRDEALILPAAYQKQRRDSAGRRKAAFANDPTGPNQVWQLDFSPVRNHDWWHLAAGWLPGLLLQIRVPVSSVPDGQQVRRGRGR